MHLCSFEFRSAETWRRFHQL